MNQKLSERRSFDVCFFLACFLAFLLCILCTCAHVCAGVCASGRPQAPTVVFIFFRAFAPFLLRQGLSLIGNSLICLDRLASKPRHPPVLSQRATLLPNFMWALRNKFNSPGLFSKHFIDLAISPPHPPLSFSCINL